MRDTKLGITRRRSRMPLLRLTVTAGEKFGDTYELTVGEHTIGSSRQVAVQIGDEGIERRHALLHVENGRARLEPLPTKVGTWHNGTRLSEGVALASGDEIEVGGGKLEVELLEAPDEPPPPPPRSGRANREEADADADASEEKKPRRRVTSGSVRGRGGGQNQVTKTADERPSFGSDHTAIFLANFFKVRPKMKFDFGLLDKARTHGYYMGDGSSERTLKLGFEPIHVLFVEPTFAQLGRGWPPTDNNGKFREVGPHPQPELTEAGFTVGEKYNQNGLYYRYVAWREAPYMPGPPLFNFAPG